MKKGLIITAVVIVVLAGGWFFIRTVGSHGLFSVSGTSNSSEKTEQNISDTATEAPSASGAHTTVFSTETLGWGTAASPSVHAYSDAELLALADNTYASGTVPLGDGKYTTDAPKKGYIYLCHARTSNQGAQANGPWISGSTWNSKQKLSVSGSVSWPQAYFYNTISGPNRVLTSNALPLNHPTGVFPVSTSDPIYAYDRNPNKISAQFVQEPVAASPEYSESPYCINGEIGMMLDGVPLFDGFDAELRDAPAHEAQDSCDGHPQEKGEYHYHSMSKCFKDIGVKTVLGYALDGFPITGPLVAKDKYLTTSDLDVCHGLTSTITVTGKSVTTYHYVMTQDFPYSASCFRGKPITINPSGGTVNTTSNNIQANQTGTPPQAAINACSSKRTASFCSFTDHNNTIQGSCNIPPDQSVLVCIPN